MLYLLAATMDPAPADNDVVAGPWGFLIFFLLLVAVAFLGWSFRNQLRKTDAAAAAGLYDPSEPKKRVEIPVDTGAPADSTSE
ncbi:hypothetical protein Back2_22960 [Nocardioides baekrokdamisoli]|uniref:Uncharacterized protein n=1 Tax=Nocardioides baekrokdamisoli TaxID=1804624 RepID=A0A3G9J4Q3_9ACTN|nr:hypothetical protein [Nocardioides baekrokdamisoli]BBH18009.1 hypothetical protein Back2_22960 [Nocardioides baekrokdamisoli]